MNGDVTPRLASLREKLAGTTEVAARLDLLLKIGDELGNDSTVEADRVYHDVAREARAAGLSIDLGRALNGLAFNQFTVGNLAEALRICNESLDLARQYLAEVDAGGTPRTPEQIRLAAGMKQVRASARNVLGNIYWQKGQPRQAIPCFQECLDISREIGYDGGVTTALSNLGAIHFSLGEVEQALRHYRDAMERELRRGDDHLAVASYLCVGECYLELGDWERALEYLFRAQATGEQFGVHNIVAHSLAAQAKMHRRRGRPDRAVELNRRALEIAWRIDYKDQIADFSGELAETFLAQGELLPAQNMLEQSLAVAQSLSDQEEIAKYHRRRAELLLANGDLPTARAEAETAIGLCAGLGLRAEQGCSWRVRGEVMNALGDRRQSVDSFEKSISLLVGTGQQFPGPGFAFRLAQTHFEYARVLLARQEDDLAVGHLREAKSLFWKLGVLLAAEAAGALLASIESRVERGTGIDLTLLHDFSSLAACTAPLSEIGRAWIALLTRALHFQSGAFYFYAHRPCVVGRTSLGTLLSLPRQKALILEEQVVQVPINLRGANVGLVYLADPAPDAIRPDRSFWEIMGDLLGIVADRVRRQTEGRQGSERELSGTGHDGRSSAGGLLELRHDVTVRLRGAEDAPLPLRCGSIIVASPAMEAVLAVLERVAPTSANVLIQGETGTGKELLARAIHELSPTRNGPLVIVNSAAMPETLLEAELFGVAEGAATGVRARPGKLEAASGGTVFLDEVGDMSQALQAKLLRVLQERVLERVGSAVAVPVNARFLAATKLDLAAVVARGEFREDLYHRLNVVALHIPPLRERREEIPVLAGHFIRRYREEFGAPVYALAGDAMDALLAYDWPGNVRELENTIERAVILTRDVVIARNDLLPVPRGETGARQPPGDDLKARKRAARHAATAGMERDFLVGLLERHDWRIDDVVDDAGISRSQLYRLMRQLGIRRPSDPRNDQWPARGRAE